MPRLIVPLPEHWYSNEPGWSSVKNPSQDIARWESDTGLSLPDDYRRFMLAFNGGYVYPSDFRHGVPRNLSPHGGDATFVSQFYDWTIAERYWHGEMWGKAKPPDMFEIGSDPDGLSIFLSLRSADHGQVFCWVQEARIWGTEGNDRLWPQAPSFEAFLDSLHDESGWEYHDWRLGFLPERRKLIQPLIF